MALTEKQLAYFRAWRAAHKEQAAAACKRWYDKHGAEARKKRIDAVREQARAYYHRSKNSDKAKAYVIANKEKNAVRLKEWQKAHRKELNEYNRKRWLEKSPRYKDVTGIPSDGPASNCEICGTTKSICMDHCHETKAFRGWLCKACNARVE